MSYGLTRTHEYEDEILLLKSRAEKAEAKLKVSEESRQNAVLCMMEANRLALEDQARAEKTEAECDELKKLISHCNGDILLGWMDAHRKAMDQLGKAEAECKRLRGLADIAIVAMQNGDFKKAETHLMPMLIRLEI